LQKKKEKKKKFAEGNVLCKIMDPNFTGLIEYFSEPSDKTKRHDINEMLLKVALKINNQPRFSWSVLSNTNVMIMSVNC
jgi:hypothetical protein